MKFRFVPSRYALSACCAACLLWLAACESSPKENSSSSGADTSGMVSDTSTKATNLQRQADSLAAALAEQSAYGNKLRNLSATINRACPVSFTPTIYLDSTRVLATKKIQFNMRLRAYEAGSSEIEPKKDETRKSLMTSITADRQPIVAELRKNGIDITFRYRDKTGQPLFDIPLEAAR